METILKVGRIRLAIHGAKFDCTPQEELVEMLWREPILPISRNTEPYIRISELKLNEKSVSRIKELILHLISIEDTLKSKQRAQCERAIKNLIRLLPDEAAHPILIEQLCNQRNKLVAYDLLRYSTFNAEEFLRLKEVYDELQDEEILYLIVRDKNAINSIEFAHYLLSNIKDNYWRCRVIEVILEKAFEGSIELSKKYPLSFIYAIGRQKREDLKDEIVQIWGRCVKMIKSFRFCFHFWPSHFFAPC